MTDLYIPGTLVSTSGPVVRVTDVDGALSGVSHDAKAYASPQRAVTSPRNLPVPDADSIATGRALLAASPIHASALGATAPLRGKNYTSADLAALPGSRLAVFVSPEIGPSGRHCALFRPTAEGSTHQIGISTAGGLSLGDRATLEFRWIPTANIEGQCRGVTVYFSDSVQGFTRVTFLSGLVDGYPGQCTSPGNPPSTSTSIRQWLRADGWLQVEIEYLLGDGVVYFLATTGLGGEDYVADGTTGLLVDGFALYSRAVTLVANSGAGSAVITGSPPTAPVLEDGHLPENGWWPNGEQCLRFWAIDARTLSFSAPGYTAISGTAQPATLTWEWAPYRTPIADATIWNFAGSTAVLKVEYLTTNLLKVTRTTDAGATVTATFDTVIGHIPQITSVVLDGTNALLYIDGVLKNAQALSLAGATTFTAGAFGGALSARVVDFVLDSRALSTTDVYRQHLVLGLDHGLRIDPIPLWLLVGQSNMHINGPGPSLTVFGAPSRNTPSIHYEGCALYSNTGWGPSRLQHEPDWGDASTDRRVWNSPLSVHTQGNYACEVGMAEKMRRVATARYAVSGMPISTFLPGGINNAAMVAAFDDAVGSLCVPYRLAGCVFVWGEADAASYDTASIWASQVQALADYLGARYGNAKPKVLLDLLHIGVDRISMPFAELIRGQEISLTDGSTSSAVACIDDQVLQTDDTHLSLGQTQLVLGHRLADAALTVGE